MRSRRAWWAAYLLAAAATVLGLAWVTWAMLGLDRSQARSRALADEQAELRLSLWQMDSLLAPILAREAARDAGDYACPIGPEGEGAGPLVEFRSDLIPLHFQWGAGGGGIDSCSSPQVGNLISNAKGDAARRAILARVRAADRLELRRSLETNDRMLEHWTRADAGLAVDVSDDVFRNQVELTQRANFQRTYNAATPSWTSVALNPKVSSGFQGVWLDAESDPLLVCVRRVQLPEETLQGFTFAWDELRALLLAQADGLELEVRPLAGEDDPAVAEGLVLSALPIAVDFTPTEAAPVVSGSTRVTLWIAWGAALVALFAFGFSLRASLSYADRRARFASAVTHELRTPLTTFRMYSEMLAKDMVPADRRGDYLATLESESERLAHLVENVLAYARIEDGRARVVPEKITAGELFDRVCPVLEDHAAKEGLPIVVECDGGEGTLLETDPCAVEQVLFNLLDNACKYGRGDAGLPIELVLRGGDRAVHFELRDHGPGVPGREAESIFRPFDRGSRDEADPAPGVGLGLALARELARALGGDLELVDPRPGRGARFRLTLPECGPV